jgi:hypothetical protein
MVVVNFLGRLGDHNRVGRRKTSPNRDEIGHVIVEFDIHEVDSLSGLSL